MKHYQYLDAKSSQNDMMAIAFITAIQWTYSSKLFSNEISSSLSEGSLWV